MFTPFTPTHVVVDPDTGAVLGIAAHLELLTQHEELYASVFWFGTNQVCFQAVSEWTLLPFAKASAEVTEEVVSYLATT